MKTPRATVSGSRRTAVKRNPRVARPKGVIGIKAPSMHDILRKVLKK